MEQEHRWRGFHHADVGSDDLALYSTCTCTLSFGATPNGTTALTWYDCAYSTGAAMPSNSTRTPAKFVPICSEASGRAGAGRRTEIGAEQGDQLPRRDRHRCKI